MRFRPSRPTPLRVHRVRAAGRIAPLLSWRAMRELPILFRVLFLLVGLAVLEMVVAFALLPLLAMLGVALG